MRPQDRNIVMALAQQLQGYEGLRTPAGRVDIVTDTEAITVAHVRWYREGIALAEAIQHFLPLTPRLHCWGTTDPALREEVFRATQRAIINLTWEAEA